jgi:hypothetical protein
MAAEYTLEKVKSCLKRHFSLDESVEKDVYGFEDKQFPSLLFLGFCTHTRKHIIYVLVHLLHQTNGPIN